MPGHGPLAPSGNPLDAHLPGGAAGPPGGAGVQHGGASGFSRWVCMYSACMPLCTYPTHGGCACIVHVCPSACTPPTRSLTHTRHMPPARSLAHSLTPPAHPPTHPPAHSLTHPSTHTHSPTQGVLPCRGSSSAEALLHLCDCGWRLLPLRWRVMCECMNVCMHAHASAMARHVRMYESMHACPCLCDGASCANV